MKKKMYLLCTGNSCRSQMAEGWAKKYLSDKWIIRSAGIEAHGLNEKAVKVMKEIGIDISNHKSEVIDPTYLNQSDLVITLCSDADERCPMTPPHVKKVHWGFDDPAKATGSEEEVLKVFRRVRDEIGERFYQFAKNEEFTY
ncbi:arsenate reductase (thioredoxin) [Fervidibacillus halotolerans]|uniref:Arsenate reductase n=1 Tax=Fervidibacillus halotolerans TaxID=2980027 RepID=A0A9E8M0V9_9BACI|nr:arsenate reductase (thioredoxin) [Fervidibacillus halotolerans]WAA13433.1 arsenate reductase (thioredoxin) [Fervidibacillus halotolerans]